MTSQIIIKDKFDSRAEGLLKDLPIETWDYINVTDLRRIYFNPYSKKRTGFEFVVLELASSSEYEDHWKDPDANVQIMFHGLAYREGLRHLFVGHDQIRHGYLFYPGSKAIIKLFIIVSALELELCDRELLKYE